METETKTETALTLKHAMLSTKFDKTEASKFLELIDTEVMSEIVDVSTAKGRTRERSLAAGISSFKVHMNKLALESIDTHMVIVKSTKSYLKEFNAESDERRDKRKAATIEQEATEQARKDGHRAVIDSVKKWGEDLQGMNLSALENRLDAVSGEKKRDFEDYSEEEEIVRKQTIENLNQAIDTIKEFDKQAAELSRLQQKEAAQLCIGYISSWSFNLRECDIDELNQHLKGAASERSEYDFGELQPEADETRANTIKEIESAIKSEETRLKLVADNQKLKDAAQKVADDIIAASKAKDAADKKVKDDKQAEIDAAKLAEEQEEDALWDAAHHEYDEIQRYKDVAADAVKAEQDKQAEAKRVAENKIAEEAETARLASEDKKHRAEVVTNAFNAITALGISLNHATALLDKVGKGEIKELTLNF